MTEARSQLTGFESEITTPSVISGDRMPPEYSQPHSVRSGFQQVRCKRVPAPPLGRTARGASGRHCVLSAARCPKRSTSGGGAGKRAGPLIRPQWRSQRYCHVVGPANPTLPTKGNSRKNKSFEFSRFIALSQTTGHS